MSGLASLDLLEAIRAALETLEPRLFGRTVDIEASRLRVLGDTLVIRRALVECIDAALPRSEPPDSITLRVARTGNAARIEIVNEGRRPPLDPIVGSMTLPLAPGASSAADA